MAGGFWLLLLYSEPDFICGTGVPGGGAVFYGGCQLHKSRDCMVEELFVTITEVILAATVGVLSSSILHASAAAYIEMTAEKALITKILLVAGKGALNTACGEFI